MRCLIRIFPVCLQIVVIKLGKMIILLNTPKIGNGLFLLIMVGKSNQLKYSSTVEFCPFYVKSVFNSFPAFHDHCRLLSCLLLNLDSLCCRQYEPRSDCSLWSRLIRVHSVCFHGKSFLECIPIYTADVISRQHFWTKILLAG